MNGSRLPVTWDNIDLVVFDLDGTLYDQKRLRMRIAVDLVLASLRNRSLRTVDMLRKFRQCREKLAEQTEPDFMHRQFEITAKQCNSSATEIRAVVTEWMEQRPLSYLAACRYPGTETLFDALRHSGRIIAVFSDYPAREKLKALGLEADIVVSAGDPDVQRLKPNPAGLLRILEATGVAASRTLMIGDRFDRDWAAANGVGIAAIIRARRRDPRCETFGSFEDDVFRPIISGKHSGGGFALPSFEKCAAALVETLVRQEMPPGKHVDDTSALTDYILATHARMPDYLRLAFRILTLIFDAWPYLSTQKPFHQMDHERRARQLRRWQQSRLPIRASLIGFYRAFTIFGLYSRFYGQDVGCEGNSHHG